MVIKENIMTFNKKDKVVTFDEVFADVFDSFIDLANRNSPKKLFPVPYNHYVTNSGVEIEVALAGYSKENISVKSYSTKFIVKINSPNEPTATDGTKQVLHQGLTLRNYEQTINVGDVLDVKNMKINFINGLLRIYIPKKESEIFKDVDIN